MSMFDHLRGKTDDTAAASAVAPLSEPLGALYRAHLAASPAITFDAPALKDTETGRAILALGPAERASIAVHAYVDWAAQGFGRDSEAARRRMVSDLLKAKLEFSEAQAVALATGAARNSFCCTTFTPNQVVATALTRYVEANGLGATFEASLQEVRRRMEAGEAKRSSEGRKLLMAVDAMLANAAERAPAALVAAPTFKPKPDVWGNAVTAKLVSLDAILAAELSGLLKLAEGGGANAKPAKGWLKLAEPAVKAASAAARGLLVDVIELYQPGAGMAPENQNTVRALLWLTALAPFEGSARRLEAYAAACLTFDPIHFAYKSLVLGNAAIHAFSMMPGTDGVASLTRLKRSLKRPGEIKTVEKALSALAATSGKSVDELEEIGLPDFGFGPGGALEIEVGPALAILTITADGELETNWLDADRRSVKSVPAAVKTGHAPALKAFKSKLKEIEETLKAQRLRLERLYLSDRVIPFGDWRERYRDEPLVAGLARRLIWSFEHAGARWTALPHDGKLIDVSGAPFVPHDESNVRLWHPMQSATTDEVLAWRRRLMALSITQPFKQAHREIYVLTDAERDTATYSNRFAAHVVDQFQFRALCLARGWSCPAYGAWDDGGKVPMKRLPERDLQVEFRVEPLNDTMTEDFRVAHLSTDKVRFVNSGTGEGLPLTSIDPVLFSELMRDADLFVGITSVTTDPTWADRGEVFHGYWGREAFGALSETGKTRYAVLKDLLPGLSIASRCHLDDRYLTVEGRLRTYRIHLGSANIQMEPGSQYLCIVQGRNGRSEHVRLPFEGDTTLSLILSKAFLLAEDHKITDPSIRSQIGRTTTGADQ